MQMIWKIRSMIELIQNRIETKALAKTKLSELGVTPDDAKRDVPVVVSLTSYPGRIEIVHKTIKTLLNQTIKPDKVILWLADEQFPDRIVPDSLMELVEYGLDIMWCDDIRSFKKLIPTIEMYHDAIIVTADDDNYYSVNWLEKLLSSYQKYPGAISAHKVTQFSIDNGTWQWNAGGRKYYKTPSYLNKLVGVGGVLYPPNCLHDDITNRELFMKLAPTNDDQWFWFMAVLKETPIVVVDNPIIHAKPVEGTLTSGLWTINDSEEGNFGKQFNALINYYPEVNERMKKEYLQRLEGKNTCQSLSR